VPVALIVVAGEPTAKAAVKPLVEPPVEELRVAVAEDDERNVLPEGVVPLIVKLTAAVVLPDGIVIVAPLSGAPIVIAGATLPTTVKVTGVAVADPPELLVSEALSV